MSIIVDCLNEVEQHTPATIGGLRAKHGHDDCVAVTATTGMAAAAIGGVTLHDFAGVPASALTMPKRDVLQHVRSRASAPWRRTKVLVLEEVSMLEADMLDLLGFLCKEVRGDVTRPFGGLQLVFAGDFGQLPPVSHDSGFAFEADAWTALGQTAGRALWPCCKYSPTLGGPMWPRV